MPSQAKVGRFQVLSDDPAPASPHVKEDPGQSPLRALQELTGAHASLCSLALQSHENDINQAADWWALGILLYETTASNLPRAFLEPSWTLL